MSEVYSCGMGVTLSPSGAALSQRLCVEMTHDARGRGMQPSGGAWDLLPVPRSGGTSEGSREYAKGLARMGT